MIRKSFVFLEGIGEKGEQNLWKQGIRDWNDFLHRIKIQGLSGFRKHYYQQQIEEAKKQLYQSNSGWFVGRLPPKENWRLYDFFRHDVVFLDIEADNSGVLLVGLFDGYETRFLLKNANLYPELLKQALQPYKLIITFNGSSFDLPRLEKQFGINIRVPHIDLNHCCQMLGLKGGLKEIEELLHLKRPSHLHGNVAGAWRAAFASGDDEYLQAILDYNAEDIINLKPLMEHCYKELSRTLLT